MERPYKMPLMLDGGIFSNLYRIGLSFGKCPEQWLLNEEVIYKGRLLPALDAAKLIQQEYIESGSQIICTPTAWTNGECLKKYGLENGVRFFNQKLSEPFVSMNALVAGSISAIGRGGKKFEDMDFFDMFYAFQEQASALKKSGVNLLMVEGIHSMAEARAAALACKRERLPFFVTMKVGTNGKSLAGDSIPACLICMQKLGAEVFGLHISDLNSAVEIFRLLSKISDIPLAVRLDGNFCKVRETKDKLRKLFDAGISVAGFVNGTPAHVREASEAMRDYAFEKKPKEKRGFEYAASSVDVFGINLSEGKAAEPLRFSEDFEERLKKHLKSGRDKIFVEIYSYDEAVLLAGITNKSISPLVIKSDSKLALETALLLYNGLAVIDKRSNLESGLINELAEKYGAMVTN